MKKGNVEYYNKGIEYCDKLSKYRNFNFRLLWKDWINYVEGYL